MSFEDKVVLVTGAGFPNGIGAGIVRCFTEEGAKVVIVDLEGAPIDETVASIPGDVTAMIANASSHEAMGKAAEQIIDQHGRIDVLVNNAGSSGPRPSDNWPTEDTPGVSVADRAWDMSLITNLRTTYASSSAVIPKMQNGGSVINIASIAAFSPMPGPGVAYGTAKAGVIYLTKTHAIEFAPRQIRVNCICPGLLYTRIFDSTTAEANRNDPNLANMSQREIFEQMVADIIPLGKEQTPEDIGNLAVFLSSDKARMITGVVVPVSGGAEL